MSQERKRAVWPWAIALLFAVLLAYPLSMGPAVWLNTREWIPDEAKEALMWPYIPLARFADVDEVGGEELTPIGRAIVWYVMFWV